MLLENIACTFKNKVSFRKLDTKSGCSYYLEARKKNPDFMNNFIT